MALKIRRLLLGMKFGYNNGITLKIAVYGDIYMKTATNSEFNKKILWV